MLANQTFPFTLTYRPTQAEQLAAARRYQSTTRKHLFYRILSIASIGVVIWSLFNPGMQLLTIIWLLLAVYTWFDPLPILLAWIGSRSGTDAPPYTATFDQQGIRFVINDKTIQRPWERYNKLVAAPDVFILVYGNWAYSIIPRRAIGDAATQAQFQSLVEGKLRGQEQK